MNNFSFYLKLMNNISAIILLCILFFLSGCAGVHKESVCLKNKNKNLSITSPFKIKVFGVECRLCAEEVEKIFSTDLSYYGVKYITCLGSYEDGYLKGSLARGGHNIDIKKIIKNLKSQEFIPLSIESQFIGCFKECKGQKIFQLHDQDVDLLVSDDSKKYIPILDSYWQQLDKNKQRRIRGEIILSDDIWWISI